MTDSITNNAPRDLLMNFFPSGRQLAGDVNAKNSREREMIMKCADNEQISWIQWLLSHLGCQQIKRNS